jgi:hypothetical protein
VIVEYKFDHFKYHYRLIGHTKCLLEEKEEKLCIKVLQTLREMMSVDNDYGDKVHTLYLYLYLE